MATITLAFHIFNKQDSIESVLFSWLASASGDHDLEVICVLDDMHDRSDDAARLVLDRYRVPYRLLYALNGWEIGCDNLALAVATGDVIVFLQDDNWNYTPGWDAVLIDSMQRVRDVGVVALLAGGKFYPNTALERIECNRPHKGECFTMQGCEDAVLGVYAVDFVTRPCAAYVSVARELRGYDWAYWPMDWDETDFSFRAHRAGYTNIYVPLDLMNTVGKRDTIKEARMRENFERGRGIFMARHGDYIKQRAGSAAQLLWTWENA